MKSTRQILREYGYRPRKGRGQNFLVRESVLKDIVREAGVDPQETVVEIGPGPGNLTRHLVKAAKKVIAIEIEHELGAVMKAEIKAENIEVIEADALELDFSGLVNQGEKLKVVANLPYNISTPVLFKLLETPDVFSELLLLLQKEVAERVCAAPGKKPYGILAVLTRIKADTEIALRVGREAFSPVPKVDSALVRITMLEHPRAEVADMELFRRVVRAAFSKRRKKLKNSFSGKDLGLSENAVKECLEKAGISPHRRPETVSVEGFAQLANALSEMGAKGA